jgi:hypothetical protein
MGGLKLISKTGDEIHKQMQGVGTFSGGVNMEFGLDRCTKMVLEKGKLIHSQNLTFDISREIKQLEQGKKNYTYVGIEESEGMRHEQMTEGLKKEINPLKTKLGCFL